MAPKLKLIYFNARGRAEVSRLLLALGGQEYEDVRIQIENWPQEKPSKNYCISYYSHQYYTQYFPYFISLILRQK